MILLKNNYYIKIKSWIYTQVFFSFCQNKITLIVYKL